MKYATLSLLSIALLAACSESRTDKSGTAPSVQDTDLTESPHESENPETNPDLSETTIGFTPREFAHYIPELPSEEHNVPADRSSVIHLPSGGRIEVEEGSFIDEDGNPITGNVNLKVRDMNDIGSILRSGIKMTATAEDGTTAPFQSAGMIEIRGPEGVYINPEKPLKVTLPSANPEADYDLWEMNESKNEWTKIAEDLPPSVKPGMPVTSEDWRTRTHYFDPDNPGSPEKRPVSPLSAEKADPDRIVNLRVSINRHSGFQLSQFSQLRFELKPGEKMPDMIPKGYRNVFVENTAPGQYRLVFVGLGERYLIDDYRAEATPVFESYQLPRALAYHARDMVKWQLDSMIRELDIYVNDEDEALLDDAGFVTRTTRIYNAVEGLKQHLRRDYIDKVLLITEDRNEYLQILNEEPFLLEGYRERRRMMRNVERTFVVSGFGIYNCDRFYRIPSVPLFVECEDAQGATIPLMSCKLLDVEANALVNIQLDPTRSNPTEIGTDSRYLLVGVHEGRVYYGPLSTFGRDSEERVRIVLADSGDQLDLEKALAAI